VVSVLLDGLPCGITRGECVRVLSRCRVGLQQGDVGDLQELLPGSGDAAADGRPDLGGHGCDRCRGEETSLLDRGLGLAPVAACLAQPGRLLPPAVLARQGLTRCVDCGRGRLVALGSLPGTRPSGITLGLRLSTLVEP
jgi:hypothetical protein